MNEDLNAHEDTAPACSVFPETLDALPIAIAICDGSGVILHSNQSFNAAFNGAEQQEMCGKNVVALLKEVQSEHAAIGVLEKIGNTGLSQSNASKVFEVDCENGDSYRITTQYVGHVQNQTEAYSWSFADISEERRKALEYERIYTQSAIGIFRSTPEGRYIAANPAAVELHGYDTEQELIDAVENIGEEIYVDAVVREALRRRLEADGVVIGFECEIFRHKSKARLWVRQNIWKVSDSTGRLLYLEGHVEDITERKNFERALNERIDERTRALRLSNEKLQAEVDERRQVEVALKSSEQKFKDISQSTSDWYWEMDENLRFTHVSERFQIVTGIAPENYLGKTRAAFHGGDLDDEHWRNHIEDLNARRPFRDFRVDTCSTSEEWAHFSIGGVPIVDDQGVFQGYRGTGTDITAQVKAERLLHEREALLRSIIDNSPSVIVVKDLEGKFVFVNQAFVKARGGSVESWIGRKAYSSSPPDHAARMRAQDREAIEGQRAVTRERRTTLLDGMPYHNIVTKFPVNDANGHLVGVASISTDVSELYKARRALEVSEERLRSIIDNSPSAIFLKGLDGKFQLVSRRFAEWFETPLEEIIGKTSFDVFPSALAEIFVSQDESIIESRQGREREVDVPFADGTSHVINLNKFPVFDPDGRIVGVGGTATDVTARNRAELALRDSETLLRSIVDNMPALISLKDKDGRYLLANKGFAINAGVPIDRIIGKTVDQLADAEEFVAKITAQDRHVLESGEVVVEESMIDSAVGPYEQSVTKFPVIDMEGEVKGVGTIIVDITERKAMEAQLQQAQKMEAVGQLTGGVAHDFNNLLGVVIGNLDILGETLGAESKHAVLIEAALRAALRGADLTGRLLAFSRKQTLSPEVVDLNALVLGMTDLLRRTLGETISIRTVAASNLWKALIDPAQLEAALLNLAVNAKHAMADGGQLTVETGNVDLDREYTDKHDELEPGSYAMLAVSDTGTGIPAENLEHVFEPFFTTKGVGEGSGLGLSMVHGFAKQSGGHVAIYSEEGAGTAVRMYFPSTNKDDSVKGDKPVLTFGPRGNGERILIVEDDPDLRRLAVRTIEGLGYSTFEASDGVSALQIIADGSAVDLLFTDVVLPGGMNGVALARAALERLPNIKVLYTSGYTENAATHSELLSSGDELLTKPYRREVLARRLWLVLRDAEDGIP